MAKITAPLLSIGASGSLAKTLVASKWKGQNYMRSHVIPANPQSTAQMLTRNAFSDASNIWKNAGTYLRAPWTLFATGQKFTDRNAFMSKYVGTLRSQADRSLMIFSPGAKGGVALTSMTPTAGANQISIAVVAPTPPTGWTLATITSVVIPNVAPDAGTDFLTSEVNDTEANYPKVITGLTTAQEYVVSAFPVWTKPDGSTAYGPSINGTATPT